MVKKLFLILLLLSLLFVMPLAIAYDTTITVSTLANHNVEIKVLGPADAEGNEAVLEFFEENSSGDGKVSVTHTSDKSRISVVVIVRKDGKFVKINNKSINKIENHLAGTLLYIELIPGKTQGEQQTTNATLNTTSALYNETNETQQTNETQTEEETSGSSDITSEDIGAETENTGKITGAVIGKVKDIFSLKTTYIIIGIIALALLIVFLVFKGLIPAPSFPHISPAPQDIRVVKYSDIKKEKEAKASSMKMPSLSEAEKKLKEVQREVEKLRKVKEIEDKIGECQKELERLKKD